MSARAAAKGALGRLAASPALSRRTRAAFAARVNVVYYHYIGEAPPYYADFYSGTTLARLDADLTRLARWFRFASLADVLRPRRDVTPLLAVTFDDGFDLIASGALDVLERHGVQATTFVMTDCVGNADLMWRNKISATRAMRGDTACVRAYREVAGEYPIEPIADAGQLLGASARWPLELKDELAAALWQAAAMPPLREFLAEHRPYLTWEGLKEWSERGHTVGHHTRTHPRCGRLDAAGVVREIVEPAAVLREHLDLEWLPFSYPFGSRVDAATERRLHEQGIVDCALGIQGFSPAGTAPYRLDRASAEHHLDYEVFGRACAGRPRL